MVLPLSGLLSCARITALGLSNGLVDQQYPHCDKDVAETALIGDCGHIYAHGSGSDSHCISLHALSWRSFTLGLGQDATWMIKQHFNWLNTEIILRPCVGLFALSNPSRARRNVAFNLSHDGWRPPQNHDADVKKTKPSTRKATKAKKKPIKLRGRWFTVSQAQGVRAASSTASSGRISTAGERPIV